MDLTRTTTALLEGLLDAQSQDAWRAFDARYRPVLRSFAIKLGLGAADAEDVTQEAITRFIKHYRLGKYDRSRGRLSSWLVAIAQNCIFDLKQSHAARLERHGDSAILALSDSSALDDLFDQECRVAMIAQAMTELRQATRLDEKTIRGFELVAIQQKSVTEAAAETGLSVDSIYAAKHRCLSQLREILNRLRVAYELT